MEATVVTAAGQLLKGSLGGPLEAEALSSGAAVACAAWSADGSAVALASPEGATVTVQSATAGATFSARMQSKARSTYLSGPPNALAS